MNNKEEKKNLEKEEEDAMDMDSRYPVLTELHRERERERERELELHMYIHKKESAKMVSQCSLTWSLLAT